MPEYDKKLYKEAQLMKRHLDIQQKIYKKSRMKDKDNSEEFEEHDILNGQMPYQLSSKIR
jgi:hypothetical protein